MTSLQQLVQRQQYSLHFQTRKCVIQSTDYGSLPLPHYKSTCCNSGIVSFMALRQKLGWSEGDLMRSDCKTCSRLMRQTAGIWSFGGGVAFWVLCRLHYGTRITLPRSLRWAACGSLTVGSSTALLVRLLSPECEPQNIAAYDKGSFLRGG